MDLEMFDRFDITQAPRAAKLPKPVANIRAVRYYK